MPSKTENFSIPLHEENSREYCEDSIVVISSEGIITSAYENWQELVENNCLDPKGYAEGTDYLKICDEATSKGSEEAAVLVKGIRDVIRGKLKKFIFEFFPYDLSEKHCILKIQPLSKNCPSSVILQYVDITQKKEEEKKIKDEITTWRMLFEQSLDGLVLIDQTGKVFKANQKFAEMLGYSLDEIHELHIWDWDAFFSRDHLLEMIKGADSKKIISETCHRRKDGILTNVEIHGDLVIFEEKKFIFCVCRDITKRKQAEEILLHAKLIAENASRSKGEFLSTMSHELRTPLNSIIGFSDILLIGTVGNLNEKQTKYIYNISNSGHHLLKIINDILDFSKVEAGKMELNFEYFPISNAIEEVKTLISPLAFKKNIEIDVKIEPELGSIKADRTKFNQILNNLLSNAIKFTPDKGKVSITAKRIGHVIEVSVIDRGIGIAMNDLSKLFQPFKQLNSYMTREHEGTGLGLVLVKKYVEMHGGKIWVTSEVGKGTKFTFTIQDS
ncbi:ATP-binding protein [uncultured Methanomethylovorans sp.]|uniref:PAS domain-containing sensor histidine kinase n=1 Tax=uncultured Methanomethylovorans sp. TaxID=183759 RepID=UPI002AA81ACD|nr:ATP-binding protein [uncultured Methanomethylovorans sp.]